MPTPIPIIDAVFWAKMLTVVWAAMIEITPNEMARLRRARARGMPAATSDPKARIRITRLIGRATFSARSRSCVVVLENSE